MRGCVRKEVEPSVLNQHIAKVVEEQVGGGVIRNEAGGCRAASHGASGRDTFGSVAAATVTLKRLRTARVHSIAAHLFMST